MIGPEQLAAGAKAEAVGDYLTAAALYRAVTTVSDSAVAAEAHFCFGRVSWRQGRFEGSLLAFESAKAIALQLRDEELIARIENGVGAVHYARGDYAAARQAYAAAARLTANETMRGKIVLNLGVIENIEGNFAVARDRYEEAYGIFHATGDHGSARLALHNRGMVEADLGDWDAADQSFSTTLMLARQAHDTELTAKTLVNRSEVLIERGQVEDAVDDCRRALLIYADVGDEVGRGEALRWQGHALGRAGRLEAAERVLTEAMHIAVRATVRLLEAEAARDLGIVRGRMGDGLASTRLLQRSVELFEALGASHEVMHAREQLALEPAARTLSRTPPRTDRQPA